MRSVAACPCAPVIVDRQRVRRRHVARQHVRQRLGHRRAVGRATRRAADNRRRLAGINGLVVEERHDGLAILVRAGGQQVNIDRLVRQPVQQAARPRAHKHLKSKAVARKAMHVVRLERARADAALFAQRKQQRVVNVKNHGIAAHSVEWQCATNLRRAGAELRAQRPMASSSATGDLPRKRAADEALDPPPRKRVALLSSAPAVIDGLMTARAAFMAARREFEAAVGLAAAARAPLCVAYSEATLANADDVAGADLRAEIAEQILAPLTPTERAAVRRAAGLLGSVADDALSLASEGIRTSAGRLALDAVLGVRMVSPAIGRGVFARRDLPADCVVAEYTGELIDVDEKQRRRAAIANLPAGQQHTYFMAYDLAGEWFIDGRAVGGVARFINHSDMPNCRFETIVVAAARGSLAPIVIVVTDRPIAAGEELLARYADDFFAA